MHYHLRTLALCITVGLAGYFVGTSVIKARFGADIQGMGTPGRISQFVTSDTIADSPIREANGNIAVGANARPQFKTLVNDGRLGVNADTTGGLGALVVNQNGSGPIATLRSGTATEVIVDADGNVGIGTDAPGSPLEVAGKIHSTNNGFMFPDGTVQTTAAPFGGLELIDTVSGSSAHETEAIALEPNRQYLLFVKLSNGSAPTFDLQIRFRFNDDTGASYAFLSERLGSSGNQTVSGGAPADIGVFIAPMSRNSGYLRGTLFVDTRSSIEPLGGGELGVSRASFNGEFFGASNGILASSIRGTYGINSPEVDRIRFVNEVGGVFDYEIKTFRFD